MRVTSLGPAGLIALACLVTIAVSAAVAPWITPYPANAIDLNAPLAPPSAVHWLGSDQLGRDILSRLLLGARTTLVTASLSALVAAIVGTVMGLVAGFFGGLRDAIIMRFVDLLLGIPGVLLAMTVIAIGGRNSVTLISAITLVGVPVFARIARAGTLTERDLDYVTAARAIGARRRYVMFRTILPNISSVILVQLVLFAAIAILLEAGLSFLGLGLAPPAPTWGGMLLDSKPFLSRAPWFGIFPGLVISMTVLSVDTLGRALGRLQPTARRTI